LQTVTGFVAVLLITPDGRTLFVSTVCQEFSRFFEISLHRAEVNFFPGSAYDSDAGDAI
jgi:hypothetical protein